MPYPRSITITTPTGWDTDSVREYAEHKVRERGGIPPFGRVTLHLEHVGENRNHTTDWCVTYVIHQR